MKLSTRLLVALLPTVAVVMIVYAAWAVAHRQTTLASQVRTETRAYGAALGAALESALGSGQLDNVQAIIDELSDEPDVYGVLVYDAEGQPLHVSRPLGLGAALDAERVATVRRGGENVAVDRQIGDERVYSYLRPLRGPGGTVGVLEVVQPLAFLESETAHTGRRFLLNTVTLFIAVTLLIAWLVRRSVTQPLERLVAAIRALGQGDLTQRLDEDPGGAELGALAREFNRMAAQLEAARAQLLREADERVALERQIRDAQRLAALGNLAAGVAHEIAAPLNVIGGRTELLLKQAADDGVLRRNLTIIVDQIRRITTIVRNLLDLAKRREASLRTVNLTTVVQGVSELLESEFDRAGVRIDCQMPDAVWVRGDPDQLHQVFVNLLINALQALDQVEGQRSVWLTVSFAGDEVVVRVEDNGPGIPAAAVQRIFDPFFTTKPAGSGLGLAVARSIVEELGGRLTARNRDNGTGHEGREGADGAAGNGGGAIFEVALAAATPEHEHA